MLHMKSFTWHFILMPRYIELTKNQMFPSDADEDRNKD